PQSVIRRRQSGCWEGRTLTATEAAPRNAAFFSDDSEVLISKSTWPLKLSGLLFAGLLVIGRSASYGDLTWTPTYHEAESPLVVELAGSRKPAPPVPNLGAGAPAIMTKAAAAEEVVFHPGISGDGGGTDGHDAQGSANSAAGSGHGSGAASAANASSTSAAAQGSGHGSGAASAANASNTSAAAHGSGHGSGAASPANASNTSAAAHGSGHGSGAASPANASNTSAAAQGSGHGSGAASAGNAS